MRVLIEFLCDEIHLYLHSSPCTIFRSHEAVLYIPIE